MSFIHKAHSTFHNGFSFQVVFRVTTNMRDRLVISKEKTSRNRVLEYAKEECTAFQGNYTMFYESGRKCGHIK